MLFLHNSDVEMAGSSTGTTVPEGMCQWECQQALRSGMFLLALKGLLKITFSLL